MRSLDRHGGAEEIGPNTNNSVLTLDVEGRGTVELNLDGLGVTARQVLELAENLRRAPRSALRGG